MKRLESNLLNMTVSLTLIALMAAGMLGGMYVLTKEPIEQSKAQKQMEAKLQVLQMDSIEFADAQEINGVKVYQAYKNGELVGAAVETFDPNGFNGKFTLMVGLDTAMVIKGYIVLEQNETPGLGANMTTWFKTPKGKQNIIGLMPASVNMTVSKEGGDVDAITAATITSRAFLRAVVRAYKAFDSCVNAQIDNVESCQNVDYEYEHDHNQVATASQTDESVDNISQLSESEDNK